MAIDQVPDLLNRLYTIVAEFEHLFPQRKFTPDGILVGHLGEALAAYHYGLTLLPQNSVNHDAQDSAGIFVQIKTTQRHSVDIRTEPNHLLVLKLHPDGTCEEFFNGRGSRVWEAISKKPMPKKGFYTVLLSTLSRMATEVPDNEKIKKVIA